MLKTHFPAFLYGVLYMTLIWTLTQILRKSWPISYIGTNIFHTSLQRQVFERKEISFSLPSIYCIYWSAPRGALQKLGPGWIFKTLVWESLKCILLKISIFWELTTQRKQPKSQYEDDVPHSVPCENSPTPAGES